MAEPIPIRGGGAPEKGRRPGRASAGPYLYAALRDQIVRAELAPGERLSEAELGERLGVSRTPIREALGRLRDDRLVEVRPQIGTFVSRISPQSVSDAQFIREALECTAVRVSAELADEESMAQLQENLRAQERATDRIDIDSWLLLDDTFHRNLCDLSGHPAVWPVNERAKSHLNRLRRLSLSMPDYLSTMVDDHRVVADAVADHDPDAAETALREHLRAVLREVPRIREQHPDYFEEP
ncbi:MAG TPA: GntR family transcriptional regulator [Solirubrobacterales bacterium]|nr:GntR family transcriptional regulator [Solirubrobacterales bacterium]